MTTIEMRLAQRERPEGRPAMHHSWRHLTFLHWPVPAEQLQRLLPPGLTVDTYEGVAYVSLVAFTMRDMRLSWSPAVPGLSASHETNVRTYVVDANGVPGVWFFSLDAANPAIVRIARAWYHLPYTRASMSVETSERSATYECVRSSQDPTCMSRVESVFSGEPLATTPGSLEFFLVERYVLFASWRGRLYTARVWHVPYPICAAECLFVSENLVKAAHIERPDVPPIVHFCPGVDVEVFTLRETRGR